MNKDRYFTLTASDGRQYTVSGQSGGRCEMAFRVDHPTLSVCMCRPAREDEIEDYQDKVHSV